MNKYFVFRLSNLSSLQLFQLIRYAGFVLIGVCFAKLYLPQSLIGRFETFLLLTSMLSFFWVSGIINSMLALYPKKSDEEKKEMLFNTFVSLVGFSVIAAAVLLVFSGTIFSFMNREGDENVFRLSVIYLLVYNPSFLAEYILFLNGRKKALLSYGTAMAALTVSAGVLPVALKYPLEYSMYGLIAVAAIRLVITAGLIKRFAAFRLNSVLLWEHLKISTPVILSIFVSGSAEYADAIIIKAKFNDVGFAVYRYGAKELPILLILANTFSSAMIPAIATNLEEGLKEIKERSARLMHLLFPITIVLMLTSPLIYRYVFNEQFLLSAVIFNIYLLLIVPRLVFPQTILTGLQKTRVLLISAIIEIIINVSLSVYLAGKLGLPGVAIGTLIAYLFDKILLILALRYAFNISIGQYLKLMPYFVYVTLTLVSFGLCYVLLEIF